MQASRRLPTDGIGAAAHLRRLRTPAVCPPNGFRNSRSHSLHRRPYRHLETDLHTATRPWLDRKRALDQERTFAHAAQPTMLLLRTIEPAAVVADDEDDAAEPALEDDRHLRGGSMTRDVGQTFLSDAIDGKLGIRRELRERGIEPALDAQP
jgi:hypothetical protein